MFSKNGETPTTDIGKDTGTMSGKSAGIPSLISSDLEIIGDLRCAGDIQVDGKVEGNIKSKTVTVGEGAQVKGSIAADRATLFGSVCQWRSKKGPPRRCKKGPLGGCGLVPVVHGRAPRATRRALNRLTRRRAREGPVGPRGQAWAGWSVQLAVGV